MGKCNICGLERERLIPAEIFYNDPEAKGGICNIQSDPRPYPCNILEAQRLAKRYAGLPRNDTRELTEAIKDLTQAIKSAPKPQADGGGSG